MPESGLDGVFTADKIWDAVSGGWTGTGESQAAVHVQLIWLDETEMSVGHACKSLSSVSFTAPVFRPRHCPSWSQSSTAAASTPN